MDCHKRRNLFKLLCQKVLHFLSLEEAVYLGRVPEFLPAIKALHTDNFAPVSVVVTFMTSCGTSTVVQSPEKGR